MTEANGITIGRLTAADRAAWETLARGYMDFYQTSQSATAYEATWRRLTSGSGPDAFAARIGGRLVGIVHYLFHAAVWTHDVCYLEDLYVDEPFRGRGVARALIERVAQEARERGASRLYWHTQNENRRARALYDKVAAFSGFIRYERSLAPRS